MSHKRKTKQGVDNPYNISLTDKIYLCSQPTYAFKVISWNSTHLFLEWGTGARSRVPYSRVYKINDRQINELTWDEKIREKLHKAYEKNKQ